jgi:2,3-bisphosphoglycerate-independent phosphoglycerate mutase
MEVLVTGSSIEDEFKTLKDNYTDFDFFFLHIKGSDSAGEDGDFNGKVTILEQLDHYLSELLNLNPDVIVISGDHSTPSVFKGHSWHSVPILLYSKWCRPDAVTTFSEASCINGSLGRQAAVEIMPLAMANALKLTKFGA